MTTLAESFLADLDDLSDDDEGEGEEEEELRDEKSHLKDEEEKFAVKSSSTANKRSKSNTKEEEENDLTAKATAQNNNNNGNNNVNALEKCTKLLNTERYKRTVGEVTLKKEDSKDEEEEAENNTTNLYALILDCNALTVDIDDTIVFVHNYIKDKYKKKFPELESLVPHPIDYARVVQKIANEMDIMRVDLESVLPSATIMVVTVTGSTTDGKELSDADLDLTLEACERLLKLDDDKTKLFKFVEKNMEKTAPNLSQVLGTDVAARVMGLALSLIHI
mgnify:CR=1 FL=1